MENAVPPVEAELLDLQWDQEPLPDAHEIIDGLFVGNADAAVEATTGPNSHGIGFILDVAGCVTPAVFAALAAALSEEHNSDADESEPSPLINCKTARAQAFSLNGIETVSIPLDDHGRTHLSEELQTQWFDFIEAGLARGKVLVHCRLGVNRSVTVVAAFLVRRRGLDPDEALELLLRKRPCADPVPAYRAQLRALVAKKTQGAAESASSAAASRS